MNYIILKYSTLLIFLTLFLIYYALDQKSITVIGNYDENCENKATSYVPINSHFRSSILRGVCWTEQYLPPIAETKDDYKRSIMNMKNNIFTFNCISSGSSFVCNFEQSDLKFSVGNQICAATNDAIDSKNEIYNIVNYTSGNYLLNGGSNIGSYYTNFSKAFTDFEDPLIDQLIANTQNILINYRNSASDDWLRNIDFIFYKVSIFNKICVVKNNFIEIISLSFGALGLVQVVFSTIEEVFLKKFNDKLSKIDN